MTEIHYTAFGLLEGCIGKLDRYNNHEICRILPVNETVEIPVTSTCLSVDCLKLKTDRIEQALAYGISCEI
jgi:hypothetical protein